MKRMWQTPSGSSAAMLSCGAWRRVPINPGAKASMRNLHSSERRRGALVLISFLLAGTAPAAPAHARITRIEITSRAVSFDGAAFGSAGAYEKLVGKAYGEIDPRAEGNAVITDLALAPRNSRGMVEYSLDIYLLKPVDMAKGNHRLLYEGNNRGNKYALGFLDGFGTAAISNAKDPTAAADAGNGWLMRQGYTIAWSGWDITAPAALGLTITVPVARNPDGSRIVGPSLEEFSVNSSDETVQPLTYPAADVSDRQTASLTMRQRYADTPTPVTNWEYVDGTHIRLNPAGTKFTQGRLYEFIYQASDPKVAGIAFAATRDFVSFLRHAASDDAGTANPLAQGIEHVYGFGISQPARFFRDFVHLGFNADETGGRVFDGIENWIGGGNGIFVNYRFAQPSRTERQHINRWYPEAFFPFAWQTSEDPLTGKTDGRLRRCAASDTCPKIMEAYSENEYWAKAASLLSTDAAGRADLPEAPELRLYFYASYPHLAVPASGLGICAQPRNPLVNNAGLRAILVALDDWVTEGKEPPQSRVPRLADQTLVPPLPQRAQGFPSIPGVVYTGLKTIRDSYDFGPLLKDGIVSVVPPKLPPGVSPEQSSGPGIYPSFVPRDDVDGNNVAGIRMPDIAAAVATYSGWALQGPAFASGDGCDAFGQMIPFAKTKAERLASGDPRLSLEERYPTHGVYVDAVTHAAKQLAAEHLLLDEDVQRYVAGAESSSIGK